MSKAEDAEGVVKMFAQQCPACRAGFLDECSNFTNTGEYCLETPVSTQDFLSATRILAMIEVIGSGSGKRKQSDDYEDYSQTLTAPARKPIYDSGYVDPDAWRFSQSIGTFLDPESTGRKLAKRLYSIPTGMVCEWAKLKNCGGGAIPIIGCLGNPATDIHHGIDRNTLNNAKVSVGIGSSENIHLICSSCHNRWHGLNNPTYPKFDRVADQERPWLPIAEGEWGGHDPVEASIDELLDEERRRLESERARGRTKRGRHHGAEVNSDASISEEENDE